MSKYAQTRRLEIPDEDRGVANAESSNFIKEIIRLKVREDIICN